MRRPQCFDRMLIPEPNWKTNEKKESIMRTSNFHFKALEKIVELYSNIMHTLANAYLIFKRILQLSY